MVRSVHGFDALCVDQENARSRITRKLVYAWLRSAPLSGYPLPSIDVLGTRSRILLERETPLRRGLAGTK